MRDAKGSPKYVICNADEGDPGAYMDRGVLEGDPHSVIEGMIIGGYALGAHEGVIYVRDEYPLAVARVTAAIHQAKHADLLGDNILGSGFSFHISVAQGAGAFVCGEETALIASIEGRVGEPRPRPPYPAEKGLWGKPTCINNVETWATVPVIVSRGGEWFSRHRHGDRARGRRSSASWATWRTRPSSRCRWGSTLRDVVEEIGGGVPGRPEGARRCRRAGPSGGCIPAEKLDLPVDYESLNAAGSIMGSGGMIVMDDHTCMVDIAKYFLDFLQDESCGKCFSCRVGTQRMKEIVTRDLGGARARSRTSTCSRTWRGWCRRRRCAGLAQSAPNPVLSTLRYFRSEYLAHIRDHKCPAKVCKELITYTIDPVTCNGCGACVALCTGRGDHRREEQAVHDRAGPLHQVRVLPRVVQVRRGPGELAMIRLTINGSPVQVDEGSTVLEAARTVRHPDPDAVPRGRAHAVRRLPAVRRGDRDGAQVPARPPPAPRAPPKGWWCAPTPSGWSARGGCCSSCTSRRARSRSGSRTWPRRMGVRECRYEAKHENCIQCGLCVRICNEQMMAGAIGFAGRGTTRKVARPFDQTSDVCRQCGGLPLRLPDVRAALPGARRPRRRCATGA